jgi:Flp pilus assembly protein TadD
MEEYEEAGDNFRQAAVLRSTAFWPHVWLAAVFVELGQMTEARAAIKDTLARFRD